MKHFSEHNPRWRYLETEQPPLNTKIMLLTVGNQQLEGVWKGKPLGQNKHYKAWSGLLSRDKLVEATLGYL
jgi:hypothetical protein